MTAITTTEFRQNLSDVIAKVIAGQEVVLVLGRGKKAKKIRLSKLQDDTQKYAKKVTKIKHPHIQKFLDSHDYKKFKPSKEILDSQKLSDYAMDDYLKSKGFI